MSCIILVTIIPRDLHLSSKLSDQSLVQIVCLSYVFSQTVIETTDEKAVRKFQVMTEKNFTL
jgi:hypothetical protein